MPPPPFPPRPAPPRQGDHHGGGRTQLRPPPTPLRPQLLPNDAQCTPRSILRPAPSYIPNNPMLNPQIPRPQPLPVPRSTLSHHHRYTSSSPELCPRVDNVWAPCVHPYPQQHPADRSQKGNAPAPTRTSSHIAPRPRVDQDDAMQRRSGFAARVNTYFVPGIRGRSASDVRIAHSPLLDLDPDRLARACGQPALPNVYQRDDRSYRGIPVDKQSSPLKDPSIVQSADASPSHPPLPKARVGDMYRRLDALARRSGRRAMDYLGFEDVAVIHKRDNQLREQLRQKRSERLEGRDPNFHAIGASLEDVLLYASTTIIIGDYQYHLPIVVVACIEELTKTGIYQCGLFRALPSRDRHLQLIDLFDRSPDFGSQFNMRGQAMPDICALLSTFISSLPSPLLDAQIYAALWHWSVKPSVKREDARRDRQEEEEEERRARGEAPDPNSWPAPINIDFDDADGALETDQISMAQILLRFLPSANLSLLAYLCGFFTQLPLCPENELQLEDVARIFGHRLLGGSIKAVSQRMMLWLLSRWHRISETLFGEMCGVASPPPAVSHTPALAGEEDNNRMKRSKGKRECESGDALCHTTSSSSSHSSPSTGSPEEHGGSSQNSDEEEEEGGPGESRQRKKRELDAVNTQGHPPPARKESRRGHRSERRGSGSRRHRLGHPLEQKCAPTSPDPFAIAFAEAQQGLADAPLLTAPSARAAPRAGNGPKESVSPFDSSDHQRQDTPVRNNRLESDAKFANVGIQALLRETAMATDAARTLAERVEVLEKALQVRQVETRHEPPIMQRSGAKGESGGEGECESEGEERRNDVKDEDGLRMRLRVVEAQRDKAQRVVHDVRAYLLNEALTSQ